MGVERILRLKGIPEGTILRVQCWDGSSWIHTTEYDFDTLERAPRLEREIREDFEVYRKEINTTKDGTKRHCYYLGAFNALIWEFEYLLEGIEGV